MDGHPPTIPTTQPLAQSSRSARAPDETGFDSQVPGDDGREAAIGDAYARFLIDSHHRKEALTRRYRV